MIGEEASQTLEPVFVAIADRLSDIRHVYIGDVLDHCHRTRREQYRKLAKPLREMGIELSTVDTVRGREKDVVILLTTKIGFDPEAAEFLDEQRRMNVALTGSRRGHFVLDHVEPLRQVLE
ncbi:hypothetical protein ANCDUO_07059 [Ancylostoma duodenale]|uniref:DNA2/NAM7 helicase-like C-terminal domain-containing protein n=1 Tax=Ancylostoma duodenale TaxID=51022 RepID=A0A0C2GMW4_9BILA|nr:hypothetical protein ANCDUO_07059 [Ancylostoma duodenale]